MLTDDDLTAELGAAFRGTTEPLTYAGRTRPRRTTTVAVPLVAATLAIGGVTAAAHPWSEVPGPGVAGPVPPSPSTSASAAPAAPRIVEDTISLAGFTLAYERRAGEPDPLHANLRVGGLPAGVRPVPLTGTLAKAWVGKDPRTGENALYVKAPTRNRNRLFVLLSSQWTQQQLVDLIRTGEPRTVPLTTS